MEEKKLDIFHAETTNTIVVRLGNIVTGQDQYVGNLFTCNFQENRRQLKRREECIAIKYMI